MENLVGKKIKGFKFEGRRGYSYARSMDKYIGEIGVITNQDEEAVTVKFKEDWWNYPLPEALEHIIQDKPTIPELGEGVMMEVSHDEKPWFETKVIAKYKNNYITNLGGFYPYARPIQPKKVTMEELEQLVGGKFEIVNK
jgi:hypothetical protein